jgi:hypothetical protein
MTAAHDPRGHGGELHVFPASQLPQGAAVGAILRY